MKDTVLIADDEQNIREGLKLILDWDELGFEICGDAADGEETLHKIMTLTPDLVLIDLNMPGMNGIDVIGKAREGGYTGKFIILTGYSDFTYAQQAIRYGVTDYIVKPIDEDKLQESVEQAHAKIEKERKTSGRIVRMSGKAKNVILREILLRETDPTSGDFTKEDFGTLGLDAGYYQIIIYEINRNGKGETTDFQLPQILDAWLEPDAFDELELEKHGVILLKGRLAIDRFNEFLRTIKNREFEKDSPLDLLFAACGRCVTNIAELPVSYEDALRLSQRRFFCAPDEHVVECEMREQGGSRQSAFLQSASSQSASSQNASAHYVPQTTPQMFRQQPTEAVLNREALDDFRERLIIAIQTGSRGQVSTLIHELGNYLWTTTSTIADVRLFVTDLYLQTKERITKAYPDTADVFESNSAIIDYGYTCFYLHEFLGRVEDMALDAMNRIRTQGASEGTIADVLTYIDHNYEKNLTLEEIAPKFGYNNVYFGKLFTKTTGSSFNNYLNAKRIEAAKELLLGQDIKIYDVARRVGYSDVDYFTRRFRKETGMRPAEYRKQAPGVK